MGLLLKGFDDPEIINALSGALAGAITATFVCPLDVLKTRLQVQRVGAVTAAGGITGCLTQIAKNEGLKGLYRGLTPTLMALLPNWAVYFTVYDKLKTGLTTKADRHRVKATPITHMSAAAGAGVATLMVTNPLWVVKTRLQTQHMQLNLGRTKLNQTIPYRGTFNALFRIAREEGITGLYSGLAPSLMGICHVVIQFPLYEFSKQQMAEHKGCKVEELGPVDLVLTSAFSKMVAATATYPHEVIRSYMHVTGSGPINGLVEACRSIFREDGLRGFYRGCGTNLLRTTPAAALTFTSFELISRFLRKTVEHERQLEQLHGRAVGPLEEGTGGQ